MAFADSADLLARVKRGSRVPSTTTFPADADWYSWITEAQAIWFSNFAAQAPWVLMGAPTLLTTADSGVTYTFTSSVYPLAVEVYETLDGRLMKTGAYWDRSTDYIWEGNKIRFPGNEARTFANGPYARWVTPPGAIDGSTEPTLQPAHTRILLVYRALALWATSGGHRDPGPYYVLEQRAWLGDPARGDVGILGMLKTQNPFLGTGAYSSDWGGSLLQTVDSGAGYRAI